MFSKQKRGWIIILIILIMSILNPSYTDFKEYTGLSGVQTKHLHKKYNFFIFSIYENDIDYKKYLAILMNFIDVTSQKKYTTPIVIKDSTTASADSTTVSVESLIDTSSMIPYDSNRLPPFVRKKFDKYGK